ncbi:EAL domain-containing protein [uncultured Neptuniibacter sp.]|uniref:putative bifunctional diguanylate cyclase/phosphodiesterase n=1 Tax=uncultured Neptuniibacter sp. TaxID=502143 RepID=UPI00260C224E|nr:EAL domain-containing protein [uncultured Neptuniibacter sp.]
MLSIRKACSVQAKKDFIRTVLVTSVLGILAIYFDLFDSLFRSTRSMGQWQLDEILIVLFILPVPLAWFTYRRLQELRANVVRLRKREKELLETKDRLSFIASHDVLTGLPNRALLTDRLVQSMARSVRANEKTAVLYVDVDGFKAINDTYGHLMGDRILISLAKRMRGALRNTDTLSRFGGDEFVVVLSDLTEESEAEPIIERLLEACHLPLFVDGLNLRLSASIGITFYSGDNTNSDTESADQLVRQADLAMYQAKLNGRNQAYHFDTEQEIEAIQSASQLNEVGRALDNNEFILFYQPKVNMNTGELVGAEALVRWNHPEKGVLPPADFLPIIESHPLESALGEWVIQEALRQMAEWINEGVLIKVSVNISPQQLSQYDFTDKLALFLREQPEVDPENLFLEILETCALEDVDKVASVMHRCQELGVKFSLDDFGTGYSSLTNMKALPIDELKIDRSFVNDILTVRENQLILGNVIGLSNALNIKTVAEGVESQQHCDALLALGCTVGQGYFYAKPMPDCEFIQWIDLRDNQALATSTRQTSEQEAPLQLGSVIFNPEAKKSPL